MMRAYLAIDLGTGSLRATLFDEALRPIDGRTHKAAAGAAIDMAACWARLEEMIAGLTAAHPEARVRAVCASSLLGWVAVDGRGEPLTPGMTYLDHADAVFARLTADGSDRPLRRTAGRRLTAENGGFKLRRLKEEDPQGYGAVRAFLTLKDFFNLRLTGEAVCDRSFAGYSALFDVRRGAWDEGLLDWMGLEGEKLPRLLCGAEPVGTVLPETARRLGIPADAVVAAGGPDGSVGVFGAGGARAGEAVDITGTTDVLFAVCDRPVPDPEGRLVLNPHPVPGLWLAGGPTAWTGGAAAWLAEKLCGGCDLAALEKEAEAVPPGCEGLIFLTALEGERTPFWQEELRGCAVGLRASHGRGHLFRAALEANACTLRRIREILEEMDCGFGRMTVVGGGAANRLWLRIRADVMNCAVLAPAIPQPTSRGCAALAALAAGDRDCPAAAAPEGETFLPSADREAGDRLYADYIKLHRCLGAYYGAGTDA